MKAATHRQHGGVLLGALGRAPLVEGHEEAAGAHGCRSSYGQCSAAPRFWARPMAAALSRACRTP